MDKPVQRTTRQRTAVANYLQDQDGFRTAQQVHEGLKGSGKAVGLTTVYRTLAAMAEVGELDVVRTAEGELSYKNCSTQIHHHHLVCNQCLKSVIVDDNVVGEIADQLALKHGFHNVDHELEFRGICDDCFQI